MIFISLLLYLELQKGTDLGADLKEAIGCQTSSFSHFNIQHFLLKIKVWYNDIKQLKKHV